MLQPMQDWRTDLSREQRLELLLRRVVNSTAAFHALPKPLRKRIAGELKLYTLEDKNAATNEEPANPPSTAT